MCNTFTHKKGSSLNNTEGTSLKHLNKSLLTRSGTTGLNTYQILCFKIKQKSQVFHYSNSPGKGCGRKIY